MGAKQGLTKKEAIQVGQELARMREEFITVADKILRTTAIKSPLATSIFAVQRAMSRLRFNLEDDVARAHGDDFALRVSAGMGGGDQ